MRIYLDDDSVNPLLVRLLRRAGHDVQLPVDVGLYGKEDPVHFGHAIDEGRVILTGNHDDFRHLHILIGKSGGHHAGVFVVRKDNDPTKDMSAHAVIQAIKKVLKAGAPLADQLIVLNHWR